MFTQGVETYFDTLYQDHNKLKDELIESVKTVTANLSAGTMPDDEGINLLKYNESIYYLCDDCYEEHMKEEE